MSPEISTVRGDPSVKDLERELAQSGEKLAATREVPPFIGRAQADPKPGLEAQAYNAVQLCAAKHPAVWLVDGCMLRALATHNISAKPKRLVEDTVATSEVPGVISRRPSNLQPVLAAIVKTQRASAGRTGPEPCERMETCPTTWPVLGSRPSITRAWKPSRSRWASGSLSLERSWRWVKSTLGKGPTLQMALPIRPKFRKRMP